MNSPLHPSAQPPFTGYGFESGRFFPQQSTPPDEPFDDENQLPTPGQFDAIVDDYLNNLSPKKRDKALVDQERYQLIQQVLKDPRNTAISTAQFRFWVKKMFQLQPGTIDLVCHDRKPVAMKEQIYSILVRAHRDAQHGGRDKTSALVRRTFSWIPKELVARFVRHCPYCITRRNGGQSPGVFAHKSASRLRYTGRHSFGGFDANTAAVAAAAAAAAATAPPILCTPSMQEDSDISSSGPPSTENGYDASPQYVSSTSSPPRRGFLYDRDEEELLRSYQYGSSSSPLQRMNSQHPLVSGFSPRHILTGHNQHHSNNNNNNNHANHHHSHSQHHHHHQPQQYHHPQSQPPQQPQQSAPQSPMFYHSPSSYMNYYYPNVLGIAPCDNNNDNNNNGPPFLRTPGAGETADILAHQEDHQSYHLSAPSTNHFMPYTSNDDTTNSTTILPAYD